MKLIKPETLMDRFRSIKWDTPKDSNKAFALVMWTPAIEAEPVREGHWIEEDRAIDTRMLRCSECRMVFNVGNGREGNYCPNCGAKMY